MKSAKIVIPAALLLAAFALTATPAYAQQIDGGLPCSAMLSRPCSPGPFVSLDRLRAGRTRKTGTLRLRIEPSSAEVYVDRVYAGVVDDFDGSSPRVDLMPGRHLIEVRAPGHESLQFETRIRQARITVYRGRLTPASAAEAN